MPACADCQKQLCQIRSREGIDEGCPMNDSDFFVNIQQEYAKEENQKFYAVSIKSMRMSFASMTRVMEIMNFCKMMDYRKIGVAYCGGMLREGRLFCEILEENNFTVFSSGCKVGGFSAEDLISPDDDALLTPSRRPQIDQGGAPAKPRATCDPIAQAILLNRDGVDFNVVLGLCVGHDSLFLKYAEAPCTVLLVKDRMLGTNPAAALYCYEAMKKNEPQGK